MTNKFPTNTVPRQYVPGSAEVTSLLAKLAELESSVHQLRAIVDGQEMTAYESKFDLNLPYRTQQKYAELFLPSEDVVLAAVNSAMRTQESWANTSLEERIRIFNNIADLISGKYRDLLVATTMLCQSKNVSQAEFDAICGVVDGLKFNSLFAQQIAQLQPPESDLTNTVLDYRPLEGFVYAITPFNVTTTAVVLSTTPALMGNVVIWKPAIAATLTAKVLMEIYREAGLPDGVINLLPGRGPELNKYLIENRNLAGIYFTGSTAVFQNLWQEVANTISSYRNFPRMVGETGGKGFIVAHPSANPRTLLSGLIRSAFEYQGQKCSACSRAYIPKSLWADLSQELAAEVNQLDVGDVNDPKNFMSAVINQDSFERLKKLYDAFSLDDSIEVIAGGTYDDSIGYFVAPTVVLATDPGHNIMCQEFFGPILSIHAYPDEEYENILKYIDQTSNYALTGSVYAQSDSAITTAKAILRNSAGSLVINDKPTGIIMGKHPFGGSRSSGTNDKTGSILGLLRWTSPRTVKTVTAATEEIFYPHQGKSQ